MIGAILLSSDDGQGLTAPQAVTAAHPMEFPMTHLVTASALALSLVASLSSAASAQSYNAPAGIPAATAPGGLEGAAAPGNLHRYEQRFDRSAVGPVSVERVETTGSIGRTHGVRAVR